MGVQNEKSCVSYPFVNPYLGGSHPRRSHTARRRLYYPDIAILFWDFYNPTGTWTANGAISGDGNLDGVLKHFGAGWPHGIGFQTAHVIEVISDDNGTITISTNASGFEWTTDYDEEIYGEYCAAGSDAYDEYFIGDGNWVILSGTGAYENLHGQGKATLLGCVDWDAFIMDTTGIYDGQMH